MVSFPIIFLNSRKKRIFDRRNDFYQNLPARLHNSIAYLQNWLKTCYRGLESIESEDGYFSISLENIIKNKSIS